MNKIRPFKGSKKRSPLVIRPSLRKFNSRLKQLRKQARTLARLVRTCPKLDEGRAQSLSQALLSVMQQKEATMRYLDMLTAPREKVS
jgi:hypothetical protein